MAYVIDNGFLGKLMPILKHILEVEISNQVLEVSDPRFMGVMFTRHNEEGVDIDTPEYATGIVNGLMSVFDYELESTFNQAIDDGILNQEMGTMALNAHMGYDYMLEFHNLHGDLGGQLLSPY